MEQISHKQDVARIEELIEAVESLADPTARAAAQELMQLVLELHGAGLARLLELIAEAGQAEPLLHSLTQDERVRALLLLHGLYPESLEQRVRTAIAGPRLRVQGIRVELLGTEEDVVRLRWLPSNKTTSPATIRRVITDAILEVSPDAAGIDIEGLIETPAPETGMPSEIFIPVVSIRRQPKHVAASAE